MDTAYFDSTGGLVAIGSTDNNDGTVIKNALILVEGTHKDNKGVTHDFPRVRIQRLVDNTNEAIASGRELPLMLDHAKELVTNGELKKLGELHSRLECRVISERDLPNPNMAHLVGMLGAFGKFVVRNRLEDVRKGLIKLLSPGVDLANERIAEVSAVAFPAIHGPALFSLNYAEAKEQQGLIRKLKDEAQECFDILFGVIKDIESTDLNEMIGVSIPALKRKAADDFFQDLLTVLGINVISEIDNAETEPQNATPNPYGPLQQQFSQYSSIETSLKTRKSTRKR